MMGLDNPIHIAFLLVILLLVFGAKRLPEMGHQLGSGLRGFKEAISGEHTSEPQLPAVTPTMTPTMTQAVTPMTAERVNEPAAEDTRTASAA
jgi:sec-independent protein translocase protein TatA